MIGLTHYLLVGVALFGIGMLGVLVRRNMLIVLMCVEIMLSGANIVLTAFSRFGGGLDGQVAVLFVFVIAACEAAVGLGLIVAAFRQTESVDLQRYQQLRG